ncbi:hypothetical protein [Saccharothrix algeriensis]|uniref:Uncharacterized protein n=1 Tax=Saccharothrix algeriensis TaxID=173560 RepID=A0A8T8I1G1_9PSEU|nr:hypothetical protein [Saccharothrix algeriensis]MBM7810361.1 hypothetical protein [Saccharothrix algeriensis]QTR04501.1 hypothetical protein J7S33_06385 [Saccharothrix algeriensis]
MRLPEHWGVTPAETTRHYPCDDLMPRPRATWYRGVDVAAPAPVVYRWLCQLRVAPYSYDLLDNLGRRSPRTLTPGAEELAVGQRIMYIFELVSFAPDEHLTIRMRSSTGLRLFGDFALTYDVRETAPGRSRLVAKLLVGGPAGGLHEARRRAIAWGDLMMMRKQLLTFRDLAEGSARPRVN